MKKLGRTQTPPPLHVLTWPHPRWKGGLAPSVCWPEREQEASLSLGGKEETLPSSLPKLITKGLCCFCVLDAEFILLVGPSSSETKSFPRNCSQIGDTAGTLQE